MALRGAFQLKSQQDLEEGLVGVRPDKARIQGSLEMETRGVL
jgi:hypothetical protein